MFDVFQMKTGVFTPLTEEQQATLTDEQRAAYDDLAASAADLTAATGELDSAIPAMKSASDALRAAEEAQRAAPKWSRIDEARRMMLASRPDLLKDKKIAPLTVVDPSIGATLIQVQRDQADALARLRTAESRQRECRGRVALALQRWQNSTNQTITQEQLVRAHLAGETKLRADRAAGLVPPRAQPRLGSAIDSFAYHTRQMGRGAGGGRAFARQSTQGAQGSFPPSWRGRTIPKE